MWLQKDGRWAPSGPPQGPKMVDIDEPGSVIEGNYAVAMSEPQKGGPPSKEEVVRKFGFDLDEWVIEKARPGYHEMGWKDNSGDGQKMPLYSMKVWLVRAVPVTCEWPHIEGAKVKPWKPAASVKTRRQAGIKRAVVVPDMHVGFRRNLDTGDLSPMHDVRACDLVAQVIRKQRPDLVVMLGDNLDLPDWSDKYITTPDCRWTTQASVDWLASWIMSWRRYAERVVYLEGNHEERIPRKICGNFEAGYGLRPANSPGVHPAMSVPSLLGLDDMRIEWVGEYPKNRAWLNSHLRAYHSQKLAQNPGHTVGKALQHARASTLFGHSHVVEMAAVTVHAMDKIRTYVAACFGTLAKLGDDGPPSAGREMDWQQCVGIVDYQDEGPELFQIQQCLIFDGRAIIEGELYESEVSE